MEGREGEAVGREGEAAEGEGWVEEGRGEGGTAAAGVVAVVVVERGARGLVAVGAARAMVGAGGTGRSAYRSRECRGSRPTGCCHTPG